MPSDLKKILKFHFGLTDATDKMRIKKTSFFI